MSDGPVLRLRPWHVVVLAALTVVVVGLAWAAPLVPVERGQEWERVQKLLGVDDPRSLVFWFASVCYAAAAAGCAAAAGSVTGRRRLAWRAVAVAMLWVWFDHVTTIHTHVPVVPGLGPVGAHLVEVAVLVVVAPAGVVLLLGGSSRQRGLLVVAALAYAGGQAVGAGLGDLAVSAHRLSVLEVAGELVGLVVLLGATTLERGSASDQGAGHVLPDEE